MVEFRKFQFDNFVIGEERPSEPETAEIVPDVVVEPVVEDVSFSEPKTIVEAEAEEIKTYSEEELAARVREAEEKAYENGFEAARSETEDRNTALLEEINNRLLMLAANAGEQECALENQAVDIARAAIHKLVPVLEKENSQALVKDFLKENFRNFKDEAKLAFYFNPEMLPFVQETIAALANKHDFEGKISLHKDNTLALSDCRVVWENGGVERDSNKMLEKVDNLLEENRQKN